MTALAAGAAAPCDQQPDQPADAATDWLDVLSLDGEGQGVARRRDGKVVFIEGALPFERVRVDVVRGKKQWEQGSVAAIEQGSSQRVEPCCPHFGLHRGACGGCKLQHAHPDLQIAAKQRVLEDNLLHLAKVRADVVLPPIAGPAWGYRQRARLSVRHVHKRGEVLVGFHERKSRYIADMAVCPVLAPDIEALLLPLRSLIASLDAREICPQIEVAGGVVAASPHERLVALVLRHLEPLSAPDRARLQAFGAAHPHVQWWLQPKGPDSAHALDALDARELSYVLREFDITMPFRPTDFTQVNADINAVLVPRALRLLDVQPGDSVFDWFCGLGNFTLPMAQRAAHVRGFEGSAALVGRAMQNFERNRSSAIASSSWGAIEFEAANLFDWQAERLVRQGSADRWLLDPPREGAFALVKALAELCQGQSPGGSDASRTSWRPPRRIVYVSCNPATLARDAGLLVHQAGYQARAAGIVNMFPHTAHVESMMVFDRAET